MTDTAAAALHWWQTPAADEPSPSSKRDGPRSAAVVERIREMILTGDLKPGQRIPERTLTEAFGVSRTPLRQALTVLAAEGLVVQELNRGAVVARHSGDVILASIEFVEILESAAGALACQRATEAEVRQIAALTYQMKAAFARDDRLSYYHLNRQIHAAIMRSTRNPVMVREHEMVNARLYRVRYAPNIKAERWAKAMAEHEDMLGALMSRDGPRLAAILRAHLSHAWQRSGYNPLETAQTDD